MYPRDEQRDDSARTERGLLLKTVEVVKIDDYLRRSTVRLEDPMMSTKLHEKLQNEAVKHLNCADIPSFWAGVGSPSTALDVGADVIQRHGEPTAHTVYLRSPNYREALRKI